MHELTSRTEYAWFTSSEYVWFTRSHFIGEIETGKFSHYAVASANLDVYDDELW